MSQRQLTPELTAAVELIRSAGGTVHFSKQVVVVWGQEFSTLKAVADDPRCEVGYVTLLNNIKTGESLEDATKKSSKNRSNRQITCWGETFDSIKSLASDPRCGVCYSVLSSKLKAGLTPEEAVKDRRITIKPCIEESPNV